MIKIRFFLRKTRNFVIKDPWFRKMVYMFTITDDGATDLPGTSSIDRKWRIKVTPVLKRGVISEDMRITYIAVCLCSFLAKC